MATPHEYYLNVINKGFDEDGVYGCQCVDGFKHFCRIVVGYNISKKSICSPTGYATSIWDNFESLGLNKYFDKVASNQMVDGDWAIWSKGSKPCPSSHIAMFRKDNGNGTGVFLGQNQAGKSAYTQINISYTGVRGALRPKCYHTSTSSSSSNKSAASQKNYVNLPSNINSWAVYSVSASPVKKNAKGYLNPQKFGGLSYYVYAYHDNGTTAEIQTTNFGRVKIYIKGTPAKITIGSHTYNKGSF
jgi:hypothetical protein